MSDAREPLAGRAPLIDAHAHFYHAASGRGDWQRVNAARLRAGDAIGITYHVASILGSFGHSSPTYFPSPDDLTRANDAMAEIAAAQPERVRWYVAVNPNHTAHALAEIESGVTRGAIGGCPSALSVLRSPQMYIFPIFLTVMGFFSFKPAMPTPLTMTAKRGA